jgi:hypothetical protein
MLEIEEIFADGRRVGVVAWISYELINPSTEVIEAGLILRVMG